jgi:hypothetical protein
MAPVWAELLEGLSPHNDEHTPICEFSEGPPLKATMTFYGCPTENVRAALAALEADR